MGAIGRQVAFYLKAFGAKVIYTDVFRAKPEIEEQLSLVFVPSFEDLLPKVDILSFHCPLTTENREMLNDDTICMMKIGAMVVNTARGKLVEPNALFEALAHGKLRSAALDVHYEEPLPQEYMLAELDNVILTPHIAGLTYEAFRAMMVEAVENITAFETGDIDVINNRRLL